MSAQSPQVVGDEPLQRLQQWIADAHATGAADVPMALATADRHGLPSVRIVLLRGLDVRGLRFFTSYDSRKGRELAENPHAAAVLYWPELGRQARVEGAVSRLSDDESDTYFDARARGHQIGAWASEQSEPLAAREILDERFSHFEQRFEDQPVPRPHSWGGFLLTPTRIEFWEHRPNRMHDRLEYVRDANRWRTQRLQP
ncbi:MAG: pyridoxamine 5'-phosphate oxidase [Candidatus Eremiobacteraeota bacterium]|nr:pyridoxamine 5'-phosphate oxidase [Candidatus Eremiobacteraeota bacterium]